MINPKYLQFGKEAMDRLHKQSKKFYISFCDGKILNVGKVIYRRRGDLIVALADMFTNEIQKEIVKTSGVYTHQNFRDARYNAKQVVEEMIKDNIIEIKHI